MADKHAKRTPTLTERGFSSLQQKVLQVRKQTAVFLKLLGMEGIRQEQNESIKVMNLTILVKSQAK